jgi:hypothetical protein
VRVLMLDGGSSGPPLLVAGCETLGISCPMPQRSLTSLFAPLANVLRPTPAPP